jgi:hypothetical protein
MELKEELDETDSRFFEINGNISRQGSMLSSENAKKQLFLMHNLDDC